MDTQKKLVVALVVLAAMGGALYLQNKNKKAEAQRHSIQGAQAELPQVNLTDEGVKKISKVVISRTEKGESAGKGDAGASAAPGTETRQEYVLERKGEESWDLSQPIAAKANASNVKSMLDNLVKLKLSEQISTSADAYKDWGLTDDKALHAVFYEGDKVVADLFFGESGSRGQMTRVAGKTGVFAAKGFSKWVYDRDLKGWRDRAIWAFDDKNLAKVSITNPQGSIFLKKDGEKWTGEHAPQKGAPGPIKDFKDTTVASMISAYKTLNAVDFAQGKSDADTGLDKPVGSVVFELKDGAKHELQLGKVEAANRWVKRVGSDEIVSISSWAADWVITGIEKFQEKKEAEKSSDDDHGDPSKGNPADKHP